MAVQVVSEDDIEASSTWILGFARSAPQGIAVQVFGSDLSIRYTRRLTDAGIDGSVGSTGNSYENALAETIIELYKTEIIRHQGLCAKRARSNTSR